MVYTKWYFYLNMGLQNMAFPIWYLFSKILKIWYFQYGIFFVKIKDMVFSLWHFILEILKYGFLKYGKKKNLWVGVKKNYRGHRPARADAGPRLSLHYFLATLHKTLAR